MTMITFQTAICKIILALSRINNKYWDWHLTSYRNSLEFKSFRYSAEIKQEEDKEESKSYEYHSFSCDINDSSECDLDNVDFATIFPNRSKKNRDK